MNPFGRIVQSLRSVAARFSGSPAWHGYLTAGLPVDMRKQVGEGTGSSTVMAPLMWILRTFPEAPPMVSKVLPDGQLEPNRRHPMVALLRRPNPHYSGIVMWMGVLASLYTSGDGYLIKIRDQQMRVVELWWTPHWLIEPRWNPDGSDFISHYEYRPGGAEGINLHPDEVIHLRFGLDPDNHRKGLSPLASVLREIYTDDEAAKFTSALLRNMGVPGILVAPEGDFMPDPDDVAATKDRLRTLFTGENRGEPLVMTGPTSVTMFGFSPEQMNLKDLRRVPEERVSAVLGVPAVVAGLGAGLDRSTFTNMAEAREMAYESNIIPTQRLLAEDLHYQLLPDFESDPEGWEVGFDLSKVRVLQEDEQRKAQRWTQMIGGGLATIAEGRRACDLPVSTDGSQDVFLRPVNLTEVAVDPAKRPAPVAPPSPDTRPLLDADPDLPVLALSNGNGNGNGSRQP